MKKGSIRKYTTFCGGINENDERKSKKKNHQIYLLTKYIKRVLWGGAVGLSYAWCLKVKIIFSEIRTWSHELDFTSS